MTYISTVQALQNTQFCSYQVGRHSFNSTAQSKA